MYYLQIHINETGSSLGVGNYFYRYNSMNCMICRKNRNTVTFFSLCQYISVEIGIGVGYKSIPERTCKPGKQNFTFPLRAF